MDDLVAYICKYPTDVVIYLLQYLKVKHITFLSWTCMEIYKKFDSGILFQFIYQQKVKSLLPYGILGFCFQFITMRDIDFNKRSIIIDNECNGTEVVSYETITDKRWISQVKRRHKIVTTNQRERFDNKRRTMDIIVPRSFNSKKFTNSFAEDRIRESEFFYLNRPPLPKVNDRYQIALMGEIHGHRNRIFCIDAVDLSRLFEYDRMALLKMKYYMNNRVIPDGKTNQLLERLNNGERIPYDELHKNHVARRLKYSS